MIGILISGHGKFATGMSQAVTMIAGNQKNIKPVPFRENMNLEDFRQELASKIEEQVQAYDGVLVFTDLKGGTPFNEAALLAVKYPQVKVIVGTNLPMLIEAALIAPASTDVKRVAQDVVASGRQTIEYIDFDEVVEAMDDQTEEEVDGI